MADIKSKIIKQIEDLDDDTLAKLQGVIQNLLNEKKDLSDWETLTYTQKEGIKQAIDQVHDGQGIDNSQVISKYRKKYGK